MADRLLVLTLIDHVNPLSCRVGTSAAASHRLHSDTSLCEQVEYWYYELIDMAKKLLVTSVLSFIKFGSALQLFIGFLMLAAGLLLVVRLQPYADARMNHFHLWSDIIQCLTLLCEPRTEHHLLVADLLHSKTAIVQPVII